MNLPGAISEPMQTMRLYGWHILLTCLGKYTFQRIYLLFIEIAKLKFVESLLITPIETKIWPWFHLSGQLNLPNWTNKDNTIGVSIS